MKKILYLLLAFVLFFSIFLITASKDFAHQQRSIYFNGNILTLEEQMPSAQALLVESGRIKAIGSNEKIKALANEETTFVDLKQKTMLPGFIDPHTHPALSTFLHNMVDLSGFTHATEEALWGHLKTVVPTFQPGEWIICKGFDPILIEGLHAPNIQFLDAIAPDNPILILAQSLHSYWGNTKAFEAVGINKMTPNPSVSSFYEKDSLGELTGFIAEQEAFKPFGDILLSLYSTDQIIMATTEVMKGYAKRGNTTIVTTGLTVNDERPLQLYEHLSAETPKLFNQVLSTIGYLPKREAYPRHFIYVRHDRSFLLPESRKNGDDFYQIIGIKHWYDGSPYTGSMYLNAPYDTSELTLKGLHIQAGYKGKALIGKEELIDFIKDYQSKDWQIAIHTQGDQANREVLQAFEKADQDAAVKKYRHRLEHCLLLQESDVSKMKTLNITPSFHINHLLYYGKALREDIIGEERANHILPVAAVHNQSINYSLHADQPMFESHPLLLIQTAVTRKTKEGKVLGKNEAIDLLAALKAMTIKAAWQIHMEDKIGSIKVGKYADFVVLDQNPLEVPIEEISKIEILKTIVNGNVITVD